MSFRLKSGVECTTEKDANDQLFVVNIPMNFLYEIVAHNFHMNGASKIIRSLLIFRIRVVILPLSRSKEKLK